MTEDQQKMFSTGLKIGMGLTAASKMAGHTPKEVSAYLMSHQAFFLKCREDLAYSSRMLMVVAAEHLNKKELDKWQHKIAEHKSFITSLNLWECHCKKKEVDAKNIVTALVLFKNMDEVATACGLTPTELTHFMLDNPHASIVIEETLSRL